jgi:3-oxoacyl-[acyl-carrier-protein] synthase II
MKRRRVVITGIGLVTPFGCGARPFWRALAEGRSGVARIDPIEGCEASAVVGAPVRDFSPGAHIDPKSLRLMSPAVTFGVAAAQLAAADSGLAFDRLDPCRLGAFVGSRGHSSDRQDLMPAVRRATASGTFRLDTFGAEGLPLVHPMWLLKGLANNVLYFVSVKYNAQGMNNNISMGGVAGTMAVGEAFRTIQRGYVDVAFAGGYDSGLEADRVEMFGVSGLVTRSTDPAGASRPFDRRRDGFVLAEGGGFVILETLDSAISRGAHLYGEVLGYGCATAPASPTSLGPSARGFAGALCAALADAGVGCPDAVFTFGLATRSSDVEETRGLKIVFGADAGAIPAPAPKSMIGNTFAASGAIEAAAAVLALAEGSVPPTINLTEPDAACDLDYVAGGARSLPLHAVAINNANFGGAHAALVLGRVQ